MTDKEANAQKRRIYRYFEKWRKILRLTGWEFTQVFSRECRPKENDQASDWFAIADVHVLWCYRQARIRWYLPTVADVTDAAVEGHVVHELVHVLVNETREEGPDWLKHEERVVTEISWAFIALERSKHNGKKEAKQGQAANA